MKDGKLHSFLKYTSAHRKLIKEVELVIIDEISMVRADIIDFIDKILRVYSQNMRESIRRQANIAGRRCFSNLNQSLKMTNVR